MARARQLCTFHVGEGYFGIPVEQVQEVVRPQPITPVPLAPWAVRGLINLRGQILIAIDLRRRLGLGEPGDQAKLMNVVVRTDESPVSFLVDEIGEVLSVDEDSFEASPETLQSDMREMIGGAYKLPGRLLLTLNTEQTVNVTCDAEHLKQCATANQDRSGQHGSDQHGSDRHASDNGAAKARS